MTVIVQVEKIGEKIMKGQHFMAFNFFNRYSEKIDVRVRKEMEKSTEKC